MVIAIQPHIAPPPKGTSFAGKTVIVTGANSGIGCDAARQFAVLGAEKVIIAVRTLKKGEDAAAGIRSDPEVKKADSKTTIEVWELDLDDYASVLKFAERVKKELSELDVLVNNAGMNHLGYEVAKSGHERVMQVNCYSHFLLTLELLPLLRSTAAKKDVASHIVFNSSIMQKRHTLSKAPIPKKSTILGYFDDQALYSSFTRYGTSKLVLTAFARELASKVSPESVHVTAICPGFVQTPFDNKMPGYIRYPFKVVRQLIARPLEQGGRTLVLASLAGDEKHGKFLSHDKVEPVPAFLEEKEGKDFSDKLWEECLTEFKELDPNLPDITENRSGEAA